MEANRRGIMNKKNKRSKSPNSSQKWSAFEQLIHGIVQALYANLMVSINQRLPGSYGIRRQIDVCAVESGGNLHVYECKDHKRRLGLDALEQIHLLTEDVNASSVSVVASNGFTKHAKNFAKTHNISLFTVIDTRDHYWRSNYRYYAICQILLVQSYSLIIELRDETIKATSVELLSRQRQQDAENIEDLIFEGYEQGKISPLESFQEVLLTESPVLIRHPKTQRPARAKITARLETKTDYLVGKLAAIRAQGLFNEITKVSHLIGSQIEGEPVDPQKMLDTWERVPAEKIDFDPIFVYRGMGFLVSSNLIC